MKTADVRTLFVTYCLKFGQYGRRLFLAHEVGVRSVALRRKPRE